MKNYAGKSAILGLTTLFPQFCIPQHMPPYQAHDRSQPYSEKSQNPRSTSSLHKKKPTRHTQQKKSQHRTVKNKPRA